MKCMHVLVVLWGYLISSLDGAGANGFELSRYFVNSPTRFPCLPVKGHASCNGNHNIAEYQIR